MTEAGDRLPEWWQRTTPAFPVDQTVRLHIPEPDGADYRITAEALAQLLITAGFTPVQESR